MRHGEKVWGPMHMCRTYTTSALMHKLQENVVDRMCFVIQSVGKTRHASEKVWGSAQAQDKAMVLNKCLHAWCWVAFDLDHLSWSI